MINVMIKATCALLTEHTNTIRAHKHTSTHKHTYVHKHKHTQAHTDTQEHKHTQAHPHERDNQEDDTCMQMISGFSASTYSFKRL